MESLDRYVAAVVDFRQVFDLGGNFRLADTVAECIGIFGKGCLGALAEASGHSRRWVEVLAQISRAYPEEARHYDLKFSHYRIAARTDNPAEWVEAAAENRWSTVQLSRQIRGLGDPGLDEELDKIIRRAEKIQTVFGVGQSIIDAAQELKTPFSGV
jgi:hypothetical protein